LSGDRLASEDAIIGTSQGAARVASVERLKGLLDYVEQIIKLDERPAFKLSEYRLATGQTYLFHQHEFHALPGVAHDLTDEDGPIWLAVERLKRNDPPKPSETLAPWLELSPDPERTPQARAYILKTLSKPECDELVASEQVRAEDRAESFAQDDKGRFDVRLRLEDRPEISLEAETYITSKWLPWSLIELPRRRSIGLYQKPTAASGLV